MSEGNTVALDLGGEERRLRYDLNAIAEIGERLDITVRLDSLGQDLLTKDLPLKTLRVLIWAGLIWENEKLTEKQVGAWITTDNIVEVANAFFALFGGIGAAILPPEVLKTGISPEKEKEIPEKDLGAKEKKGSP